MGAVRLPHDPVADVRRPGAADARHEEDDDARLVDHSEDVLRLEASKWQVGIPAGFTRHTGGPVLRSTTSRCPVTSCAS